jgi:hypothetical protein
MLSRESGTTTKTQLPRSIPTIDYSPPAGFEKHSSNQEGKTKVSQVFSSSNLAGKQLWYITAPASVPISSVKEVSLQNVQLGKPALSLNGREYGFVQGHADEKGCAKIMVPDGNSPGYHIGKIHLKNMTGQKTDSLKDGGLLTKLFIFNKSYNCPNLPSMPHYWTQALKFLKKQWYPPKSLFGNNRKVLRCDFAP